MFVTLGNREQTGMLAMNGRTHSNTHSHNSGSYQQGPIDDRREPCCGALERLRQCTVAGPGAETAASGAAALLIISSNSTYSTLGCRGAEAGEGGDELC